MKLKATKTIDNVNNGHKSNYTVKKAKRIDCFFDERYDILRL